MLVDRKTIEQFREHGVVLLRGAFTDWIDILGEGIAANLRDTGPDVKIYTGENGGRFIGDYCN